MKHRVPILKFINKDQSDLHSFGNTEAFALIGGRWYYAGYVQRNFGHEPDDFGYHLLNQYKTLGGFARSVSSFDDGTISRWSGIPVKQLRSKTFIHVWENNPKRICEEGNPFE